MHLFSCVRNTDLGEQGKFIDRIYVSNSVSESTDRCVSKFKAKQNSTSNFWKQKIIQEGKNKYNDG